MLYVLRKGNYLLVRTIIRKCDEIVCGVPSQRTVYHTLVVLVANESGTDDTDNRFRVSGHS